ncbi:MAG: hypothetical protein IKR05_05805 [Prevotella sp.]|nr:hypothetical protein [Prevotella sp.]
MKTYVIMLSEIFPKGHPREGQPTGFKYKIERAIRQENYPPPLIKLHTIRGNWETWEKRFKEIYKGDACLSLQVWEEKPYRSKQIEIARLTAEDGIGLQKFENYCKVDGYYMTLQEIAENDGLFLDEWESFIENYPDKPLAIIQFTKFRYGGNNQ